MPRTVYYGEGSLEQLRLEVNDLGTRALIVSDKMMNDLGYVKKLQAILSEQNVTSVIYLEVDAETKDTHVYEAFEAFKEGECDFIIALGGGSCIDAAKACAVVANNRDVEFIDYIGTEAKAIENDPVPVVAIPTTAGTGSEVTDVMVITNTSQNIKMMIKQPKITPKVAIVDPTLTISAPRGLTVATGIDALSHGIEAFLSRKAHPFTNDLALSAIKAIVKNIRKVYENPTDLQARSAMSLASMQAGIAFSNSSVTLVHGMSRPIGAVFNVPHGISNAMLLVPVLEYSFDECVEKLAEIGRYVDETVRNESDEKAAEATITMLKRLCKDLEIPSLKEWGIDEETFNNSLDKMAADALQSGSPSNHPKIPTKEELIELYNVCYTYKY